LEFVLKQDDPCSAQAAKQKRTSGPKQDKTVEALYQWYKQKLSVGISLRGVELQAAAERLDQRLGEPDFKASTDWLFRFCNRHGIANIKICGESLNVDDVSVEQF
jgi:hypothetical protein